MTDAAPSQSNDTVELAPSYTIPLVLVLVGLSVVFVNVWIGAAILWSLALPIALFGTFLLFQAVSLRLQFTPTDLDIYRGETRIRRFPYQEWQNWEIFWSPVPILFYFREIKSIHFLPIIFDPKMLRTCLEQRYPKS